MFLVHPLRPAGALAIRSSRPIIGSTTSSTTTAAFSTAARPATLHLSQRRTTVPSTTKYTPVLSAIRAASNTHANASASTTANASSAASNASSSSKASTQLTWNRFLELRRTRRKISVVASSVSSVATAFVGLRFFLAGGYDAALAGAIGLDPLVTTGLSAMAFLAMGWLLGPFVGNALFNLRHANIRKEIVSKEREFYARIKRHRVDPTSSSMANPVPDYYGEKIGSVAGYRRWLKDQRAFNLKRGAYLGTKLHADVKKKIDAMPHHGYGRTALVFGLWGRD